MSINLETHKVKLFSATLIGLTCMVGSGWLFSPMIAARVSGNYAFLAWIVAAAFIMCVAFCFSVLFVEFPLRGITARMSSITHNNVFGMPFAFVNWFGIIATVATEAQATTQYLSPYLGSTFISNGILSIYGKFIGFLFLCAYLLINYYGIKLLARINNIITILKFSTPIIVLAVLLIFHFSFQNFHSSSMSTQYDLSTVPLAIIAAGMIYAFNGFQSIGSFASEITNHKKNIPLALFISISIALLFYLLVQFVFMGSVPHDLLKNGWAGLNFSSPMIDVTTILGLHLMSIILVLNSIISPSATGYTYLGSTARMLSAMAEEKQVPGFLKKIDKKYNFPKHAMVANFLVATLFLFSSSGWGNLVVIVTMFNVFSYMSGPISMGAIKKYKYFGCLVLIFICLLLTAAPTHDLLITNQALSIVIVIFLVSNGIKNLKRNILYLLPFYAFIWSMVFLRSWYEVIILAIVFYFIVISKYFVQFCKNGSIDSAK